MFAVPNAVTYHTKSERFYITGSWVRSSNIKFLWQNSTSKTPIWTKTFIKTYFFLLLFQFHFFRLSIQFIFEKNNRKQNMESLIPRAILLEATSYIYVIRKLWESWPTRVGSNHRYRKAKIDCLSLIMCPLLAQHKIGFFSSFSAAAVYSTNETNKAGLKQSIIFRCLWLKYCYKC